MTQLKADGFARVYEREAPHVLAYLRAQSLRWDEVEDLGAETFTHAWAAWERFRQGEAPERHWLLRIARNLVIDRTRRQARHPEPVGGVVAGTGDSTGPMAVTQLALEAALTRISPGDRELIGLRAAGLSFAEVGAMTGRTDDAAKMAWHRAAKRLRKLVEGSDG